MMIILCFSVKLKFTNRGGQSNIIVRSMQLVQGKTKDTFKNLDGIVRSKNDNGEWVSIGHKCAELDRLIPDLLGVSRSILENVIFCHQEDANWPLAESTTLKKKFDDIFESARYTKALEAIRKVKVTETSTVRDHKSALDLLERCVKEFSEVEAQLEKAKHKLTKTSNKMNDMGKSLEAAQGDQEGLDMEMASIVEMETMLERLRAKISDKAEAVIIAHENIEQPMEDSDAELIAILNDYDNRESVYRSNLDSLREQESQLGEEKLKIQSAHSDLCVSQGKLQAALETQENLLKERRIRMQEMSIKYGISVAHESSSTQDDVARFSAKANRQMETQKAVLKDIQSTNRRKEESYSENIAQLKAKLNSNQETIRVKKEECNTMEESIRQFGLQIAQVNATGGDAGRDVLEATASLTTAEMKLADHRKANDVSTMKMAIQALNKKINDVTYQLTALDDMMTGLRRQEKYQTDIRSNRVALDQNKSSLVAKVTEVSEELQNYLNKSASYGSIKADVTALATYCVDKQQQRDDSHSLFTKKESKRNLESVTLDHLKKEIFQLNERKQEAYDSTITPLSEYISEHCPGRSVKDMNLIIEEAAETLSEAKKTLLSTDYTVKFLRDFEIKGQQKHTCPACTRSMSTEEEGVFTSNLERRQSGPKLLQSKRKAETAVAEAKEKVRQLNTWLDSWKDWIQLENSIPTKIQEVENLQATTCETDVAWRGLKTAVQRHDEDLVGAKNLLHQLKSIDKDINELGRRETRLQEEEESFVTEQVELFGKDHKSLSEVQEEKDKLHGDLKQANMDLIAKQNALQRQSDMMTVFVTNVQKCQKKLDGLKESQAELIRAKEEREKLRQELKKCKSMCVELESGEPQLQSDVHLQMTERNVLRSKMQSEENKAMEKHADFQNDLATFESLCRRVATELLYDRKEDLCKTKQAIKDVQAREQETNASLETLAPQLKSACSDLEQQENFKRHIRDNVAHRNLQAQENELRQQLSELETQYAESNNKEELEQRMRRNTREIEECKHQRSVLDGKNQQLEELYHELNKKLQRSDLRDSKKQHREKLIDYETTQLAVKDLDKYYKALDTALVEYHQRKIKEINAIIKELWQITYRGQDIETIEIASGQDTESKSARAYNYRVVMKKCGARLEMRGRCSAGQKVLAALVIRLALAETFCLNCGILALDGKRTKY